MQVVTRRLIIIAVIALGGGAAGLALGNFASGNSRSSTAALGNYTGLMNAQDENGAPDDADVGTDVAAQAGPTDYQCQGCDAHLHNDMIALNASAADATPLPPYKVEDAPAPAPTPNMRGSFATVRTPSVGGRAASPDDGTATGARPAAAPADRPRPVPSPVSVIQ